MTGVPFFPFFVAVLVTIIIAMRMAQKERYPGWNYTVISMVRNEGRILGRMLASVRGPVLLCDTGSTDDTHRYWTTYPTVHHNWTDRFDTNRNMCLTHWLPRVKTDFVLFLDADHQVEHGALTKPQYDMNFIHFDGNSLPYLVRTSVLRNCKYRGVTHEFLHCTGNVTSGHYHGMHLTHFSDGSHRIEKYIKDRQRLERALEEEQDPMMRRRYVFYLARTLDDMLDFEEAEKWYKKRTTLGGWEQEIYYSWMRMGAMQLLQTGRKEIARVHLLKAYEVDPNRKEALYHLAQSFRQDQRWSDCLLYARAGMLVGSPEKDALFVRQSIYDWAMEEELAYCLYHGGRPGEAVRHWQRLLKNPTTPGNVVDIVRKNVAMYGMP